MTRPHDGRTLLCVANFPAGTGFAWDFIEGLYADVADRLVEGGIRTLVAYPALDSPPATLAGSSAVPIMHAFRLRTPSGAMSARKLVRDRGVDVVYLADRPAWSPAYPLLRQAGVRRIVVHDHTSGARTRPRGPKRWLKAARRSIPGTLADHVLAVSEFVARRKIEVDLVPRGRVTRIWNSIEIRPLGNGDASRSVRRELGVEDAPLILCACRASPPKGIAHLLRAFDRMSAGWGARPSPQLLYAGDGPAMDDLRALRDTLPARDRIRLLGYRADVARITEAADLCVVPSVWEEAFGLAALEPMERGRAVIASRVGGIPEVVLDGETGLLVPPGDEPALAYAMGALLADPMLRTRMGRRGRDRAAECFSRAAQIDELARLLGTCFE